MDEPTRPISFGQERGRRELQIYFPETFRERFYEAKNRSRERLGRKELTNREFLMALLDVWEEYEEPRRIESEP